MDREYAVSYKDNKGVLDEMRLDAAVIQEAKAKALWYVKNGFKEVTIKLYDDGDLKHQWDWDYTNKKWKQYE